MDDGWKCSHCGELVVQEEIDQLRLVIEAAGFKLREAFDYAEHRWSEWGDRAEGVAGLLEELEQILAKTGE